MDLFITAAGTEIGKTFVTARLIEECNARGISCTALKPIITGFEDAAATDTARLLSALGIPATDETIEACSPWRFAAPLSPNHAAAREGREVSLTQVLEFCKRPTEVRLRLIEGIGGVMVPINDRETVLDWIAALGAPAVLIAGSYLGAMSHALTAFEALRSRAIAVHAVVVSQSPEEPVPLAETCATLRRFVTPAPLVSLARDGSVYGDGFQYRSLLEALALVPAGS